MSYSSLSKKVHKLHLNTVSIQGSGGDVIEGPGYQGGYGPPGPPVRFPHL